MKKFLLLFLVSSVFGLLAVELYYRAKYSAYLLDINWTALDSRWREPYLAFGDFRAALGPVEESPEHFGYLNTGPLYLYQPKAEKEVHSITDRGRFLYVEQEKLANNRKMKRIFVVGASAALGDGGGHTKQRFLAQLERKLRRMCNTDNLYLIPAAVRSFISTQERIALELYVLPLNPDAVIFFHGYNDLNHADSMARPGDPYNQGITYARSESFAYQTIQWLAIISRAVQFHAFQYLNQTVLKEKWGMATRQPELMEQYSREISSLFLENVNAMAKRCAQEKTSCYFFNQPAKLDASTRTLLYWNSYNKVKSFYARAKGLATGATVRDLVPEFLSRPDLFVDPVHMNNEGQDLVSDEVVKFLESDKKRLCSERIAI